MDSFIDNLCMAIKESDVIEVEHLLNQSALDKIEKEKLLKLANLVLNKRKRANKFYIINLKVLLGSVLVMVVLFMCILFMMAISFPLLCLFIMLISGQGHPDLGAAIVIFSIIAIIFIILIFSICLPISFFYYFLKSVYKDYLKSKEPLVEKSKQAFIIQQMILNTRFREE